MAAMKARQSSSPQEKIRLRTWRIDSACADPPRLIYEEVDPRLSVSPFGGVVPEIPSPERHLLSSPLGSTTTSTRSLIQAPDISPRSSAIPSSHTEPNPFDSNSPNGFSQWSTSTAALGRANGTGKSGKVIEKLANDLDSAHRERDLYKMRNEELERRLELCRTQLEELTERKNRAEQESAINAAAISRKDRKIGELQTDLDEEVARRTRAETESKIAINERDDTRATCDREVTMAQERAVFADMSYDLVLKEREKDKTKFQDQIDKLQADVKLYFNNVAEANEKIRKLNMIAEQKDAQFDKMDKGFCDVMGTYEKYIDDRDNDYNGLANEVRGKIQKVDDGLEELKETKDKMNWVINVKDNVNLSKEWPEQGEGVDTQKARKGKSRGYR